MGTEPRTKRGRARTRTNPARIRALDRGLAILELLSTKAEAPLTQIAAQVGLPVSTAHRVLETLRQRGFVGHSAITGNYRIGIKAFEVGTAFLSQQPLPEVAQGVMEKLVEEVNETANLAVLDGSEAVYISQVESQQKVRMFTRIGARTPLHCSGVGKALLAWMDEARAREIIAATALEAFTPATITDAESLRAELERVKTQGYALDMEEYEPTIRCVAAPVRDHTGAVIAALSVSAPLSRFARSEVASLAEKVVHASTDLSRQLGWIPERD